MGSINHPKAVKKCLAWISLLAAPYLFAGNLSAGNFSEVPAQFVPPAISCLPASAMTLGQLNFASQRAQVIQQLGAPLSLHHYQAEDDAGLYTGEILNFQNTQIYFNSTRGLQRIITSDATLTLPLNLHLGQTLASIQSRIKLTRTRQLARYKLDVCSDESISDLSNREVYLDFDTTSFQLIGVDMMTYGP